MVTVWPEWERWCNTEGKKGEEPPQKVKNIREWYEKMLVTPDEQKRIELGKKILKSQAENLWVIGTVGKAPHPIIASDRLANVPESGLWTWDTLWTDSRNPEQFYLKDNKN